MKNNKLKMFLLGIVGILFLSACATHKNFIIKHNAWVGRDIHAFIAQVGHPDQTYTLPNKNAVYIYAESRIHSMPMMMGPWGGGMMGPWGGGMMMGGHIEQRTCKLFLEVNKQNKIVRWSSRGNNCVSSHPY